MLFHRNHDHGRMDLFGDTAAILNSIVSNSYDGMLRVKHPIIAIETIEFKMVIQTKVARIAVSHRRELEANRNELKKARDK